MTSSIKDQIVKARKVADAEIFMGDSPSYLRWACDALEASHAESEDRMARCVGLHYRLTKAEERIAVLEEALRFIEQNGTDPAKCLGSWFTARQALKGDAK